MTQDTASINAGHAAQRVRRRIIGSTVAIVATIATACADVGSGPDVPAALEFARLPYPAVVVGDSLRNEAGVIAPLRAIVRNSAGEEIVGAPVTYLYADYNRDSSLVIDSTSGTVFARKITTVSTGRVAARAGSSLQILGTLFVTLPPDTITGSAPGDLKFEAGDSAQKVLTGDFSVLVRHNKTGTTPTAVKGWIVRYTLLHPANPTNDTSAVAYLAVDERNASVVDTTGDSDATRKVMVRKNRFLPDSGTADSLVVQATVQYRGKAVPGSPLRLVTRVVH